MKHEKDFFKQSAIMNKSLMYFYFDRLTELALSAFKWENLPETIDPRFLELTLFENGQAVYFRDPDIGDLCLQCAVAGRFNVYRVPLRRRAYAINGYNKKLTINDSVIIYNNYLRKNSIRDVSIFAMRLANLDRTIDVNTNAQKTPVLVQASEKQRLTMLNLYQQYDGNAPVIFGDSNLDISGIKSINTSAPYVSDKLYELKTQIWNEALTYLGISNINIQKKERLITDEVNRTQGGTVASRYSRLEARREACEKINKMFGLDIWVNYREDYQPESNIAQPLPVLGGVEDE